MLYEYFEALNTSESGWVFETRIDDLTYVAAPDNVMIVLRTQHYAGFPLGIDVSSWSLFKEVTIGWSSATVVGDSPFAGYDCWECEISNESYVYYDMESGIFVHSYWSGEEGYRTITLEDVYLEELEPYLRREGVLLSAIFIELSVIIWLLADRLKKKSK